MWEAISDGYGWRGCIRLRPRALWEAIDRRWRTDARWPGEDRCKLIGVLRVCCYEQCYGCPPDPPWEVWYAHAFLPWWHRVWGEQ